MLNENLLGNKLYELRKQHRLSQEELAEKLNVSRQAISKWECGESLPDTENLIALSKLYCVSLDELVGNNPAQKNQNNPAEQSHDCESKQEKDAQSNTYEETQHTYKDGIHVHNNDEDEDEDDDDEDDDTENYETDEPISKKKKVLNLFLMLPYPIVVTIAYLLWGFLGNGWALGWTLYVTVPVYYSIIDCIRTKKASRFVYPVLVTFIYLFVGMKWGFWHPNWVIFITIPIYYPIVEAIERK